jgi:hypothetical protein
MADLRSLMRTALQASSDTEIIEVLQVGRSEMSEAIKTLQRAFEEADDAGSVVGSVGTPTAVGKGQGEGRGVPKRMATGESEESTASTKRAIALDREVTKRGIDALRRLSLHRGVGVEGLPSPGTFDSFYCVLILHGFRYEVIREEKIGIGFFSDVHRGTWRQRHIRHQSYSSQHHDSSSYTKWRY